MNNLTCTLFNSQSGALSARLDREDGSMIHLHSLVDPEKECEYFSNLSLWGDCILLAGSGLGYHLSECLQAVDSNKKIVLMEFYPECAQHCALLIEKKCGIKPQIITSENSNDVSHLVPIINDSIAVQIVKHPASYRANKPFYDNVLKNTLSVRSNRKQCIKGVCALLHGNFFLQQEISNAMRKSGDRSIAFDYSLLNDTIEYEQSLQRVISEKHPEMFVSVNMLGIDGNGVFSEYTVRNDIPVAVWFVDDPRPILLSQQEFVTKNMVAFCWERSYFDELKRAGFNKVHYLPLATDLDLFEMKDHFPKTVPLGFTGTSMAGHFRASLSSRFLWNKSLEPLVFHVANKLLKQRSLNIDTYVAEYCTTFNVPVPFNDNRNRVWLRSYIIHTAGMLQRKQLVDTLREFGIQTFGDSAGWKELCGEGFVRNPDVEYRTKLADVYRSTVINVNSTSCQMPTAVNQRVFDIPACGSFLLTDCQSDLNELFTPDEAVVYHSLQELKSLIRFYQNNDSGREAIIMRARIKIINEHTYEHRYKKIRKVMHNL